MPASIFSETELARWARFPEEIPGDDLIRAFTLTGADRDLVAIRRGAANRLGLALQLCALRYLGFVPRNLSAAPRSAACFVADQLSRSARTRFNPTLDASRRADSTSPRFREPLGFSMLRSRDLEELEAWLVERALEHEAPKVLFRLARERLRTERLVFPAPDRIVRLVSSARGRAQERTYTLVEPLLSAERRAQLDGLLEAKASNSWSTLKWLGQGASGESPGSIKSEVAKLAFLRQLGAHEWDLSDLNPNRVLLHETTLDLVDEIVDLLNRALKKTDSRSRRELEAWRVATAQAPNEKVRLFSRLGRLVLDPDIPDEPLRRRSFEEVASRELFAAAVEETEPLLRPRDGSYLDFVENRYGPLRKFAPLVLRVLDFKSLKTDDPLIDAVEILRELNRKRRRRVPEDAGLEFASAKSGAASCWDPTGESIAGPSSSVFSTHSVTAFAPAPSGSKEVVASQIPPRTSSPALSGLLGDPRFSGSSVSSRNPESPSKHSPTRRRQSSNISVRPRSPSRRPCAWRRVGSCSRPLQWRSCPTRSFS